MKKKKIQRKQKILAVIMSVMILTGLMPGSFTPVLAASEGHENCYTIKVTDEQSDAIANAAVSWIFYDDADGSQEMTENVTTSGTTDEKGIVEIPDVNTLAEASEDGIVYFQIASVSAEGYVDYKDETVYMITDPLEEKEVSLAKNQVEQKYYLTGKVTDEDQMPLSGVTVQLQNGTQVQTAEDGTYSLEVSKGEAYKISFSLENYYEESRDITITGENDSCDIVLRKINLDTTFKFEDETPQDITYGDSENNYVNKAVAESDPDANITYTITRQTDLEGNSVDENKQPISVADIDETGTVSIKRSGVITVQATKAKDELFDETTAEYTLRIKRAQRTGYVFANATPEDQYLADGKFFDNPYSNGIAGDSEDIQYVVVEATAKNASVDKKGCLTYDSVGTVTVKATKPADECYEEISGIYTVTILKKEQQGFHFKSSQPTFVYGTENDNRELNHYQNPAEGGNGDGAVTYKILEGVDVAEINEETGELTINKSGKVKVQATKASDDYYKEAFAEYTLVVLKGTQIGFSFERQNPEAITWNDENRNYYKNEATGGSGTGEVTYAILKGTDVGEINEQTGEIQFKKAGTVEVQATKSADECYEAAVTTYEIKMLKADQNMTFPEESVNLEYGVGEYVQTAIVQENNGVADGKGYGTGAITYQLTDNTLNAQIDENSGKLTFADENVGSVIVTAKKEADECYNECEVSYKLKIEYMEAPAETYQLDGLQNRLGENGTTEEFTYKGDSTNEWFTDSVTILAPEGYQISTSNHFSDGEWSDSISYIEEGCHDIFFYLKNSVSGGITDMLTIHDLKIDKENPTDLQIEYPAEGVSAIWKDSVLYGKDTVAVKITAKDKTSGLQAFYYQYQSNVISISSQGKDWTEVDLTSDSVEKTENEDGTVSYQFEIPAQFRGNVYFKAVDQANRVTECWDDRTVVADNLNPKAKITYEAQGDSRLVAKITKDTAESHKRVDVPENQVGKDTRFIYDGAVTATIDLTEANFEAEDVLITVKKDGTEIWSGAVTEKQEIKSECEISEWTVDKQNDKEYLTVQLLTDGDYEIEISYKDRSDNKMKYSSNEYAQKTGEEFYQSNIITIDTTNPEVEVSYDNNAATNKYYYNADRVATIKVTDRNFRPSEVDWKITAKDGDAVIDPKTVEDGNADTVDYVYSDLKDWSDWKQDETDPSVWYAKVSFDQDAFYNVSFEYQDLAEHTLKENYSNAFVVDKTKTQLDHMEISYSDELHTWQKVLQGITFGYFSYNDKVTVTLKMEDGMSGIDYLEWTYKREADASATKNVSERTETITRNQITYSKRGKQAVASFTLEATDAEQFRGAISYTATDMAGNTSEVKNDAQRVNIVDNIPPEMQISYAAQDDSQLVARVTKDTEEAHMRADVPEDQVDENTRFIYNGAVTAYINVTEANFEAEDVLITVKKDGTEIWNGAVTEKQEIKSDCEISEWTVDKQNDKENLTIQLLTDGDYEIEISYKDRSDNKMKYASNEYAQKTGEEFYQSNIITIDTTNPEVEVSYDNNAATNKYYYNADRVTTIKVTDRNFRPSEVDWKITAKDGDAVIDPKTVEDGNADTVDYVYSDLKDWSDWKQDETDPSVWYAKVSFDQDAFYNVTFACQDLAGHALKEDYANAFVVDTEKAPLEQMEISYSNELHTWQKVIQAVTFGYFSYKDQVTVTLTSEDEMSGIDYLTWTYRKETGASATKNVNERTKVITRDQITYSKRGKMAVASFTLKATDAEQFRGSVSFTATDMAGNISDIKADAQRINIVDNISPERTVSYSPAKQVVDAATGLTKNNYKYEQENTNSILYYDGDVTVNFRVEEANFYAEDVSIAVNGEKKVPENWKQNGDVWTSSLTLHGDGDYYVTMDYTDRSDNQMHSYKSEKIVIDTKAPVIQVVYGNQDVKGKDGAREYFDRTQTATIRITEHNFRADDVAAEVTAVDVTGRNVTVADYAAYLANRSNWKKDGDVYTANITYPIDANYSFDISYSDLAGNEAADYEQDLFTVDQTAPTNLSISYSEGVQRQNVGITPFRYYNQMMTVTISGDDVTSGIEHFVYNYRNGAGVSSVNAQLLEAAIEKAEVIQEGVHFTARFTIPRYVLQGNNQFNGTVDFVAYDYAVNQTGLNDSERIVVDNTAPTVSVTYNDPVQENGGIAYYAGDIDATVEIREANFYAEDVQISVEKDGQSGYGVSANWIDNSADIHTGTFRLSEDGDYLITINYTDRSRNRMETYTSGQLTIDTQHPTIYVSGLQANSANKEEPYGFTLTVSDSADNLQAGDITPVLSAVICDENGNYVEREMELPSLEMTENNQSYNIQVENLEEDGVYTLSCKAKDLANQEYNLMTLDDGQEYETVTFSVNRNGSTFRVDENTAGLLDQYYVYEVPQDVVIEEINTDPIENYVVKMNGNVLKEGSDYTTDTTSGEGTWSVRTYSVKKELFDTEGEYNLVVESVDKTETAAYSDVKNLKIAFVVDQTAPVVVFSGLENGGRYESQEQIVTAVPTDDGGKLKSFQATVMDKKGEQKETLINLSGEELETYLEEHDGQIDFAIPEGLEQQVTVSCTDCAVKEDGSTNTYKEAFENVTVSTNKVIIFFANKPLFYGVIIVCCVAAAGVIGFVVWKKKKKVKSE